MEFGVHPPGVHKGTGNSVSYGDVISSTTRIIFLNTIEGTIFIELKLLRDREFLRVQFLIVL